MINKEIQELIPLIKEYFRSQPIKKAWLFGSCSRGEETKNSDIDILVDYDEVSGVVSLFTIGNILKSLSTLIGRQVDLVDTDGILDYAKSSIEKDKILIYERTR